MFKTELHCHSAEVSNCAHAYADYIVDRYISEGYSTIVLTNHFNKETFKNKRFDMLDAPWDEKVDYFMNGYHKMVEAAAGRINIILGMELRFFCEINDYLVYGITEEFLRAHPEMMDSNPKEFSPVVRDAGMLFIQAHPFRNGMKITNPAYLDGVEVNNGHTGHDSRNDIAYAWAEKFGLIKTSGTDFHDVTHVCGSGIATESEIKTTEDLLETLKSGKYEIMRSGAVPY